jgi:eukaryotic-like serine/threonine-protein kinase
MDNQIVPAVPQPPASLIFSPTVGTQITCTATGNTYTFGKKIGEGFFAVVHECTDVWNNELAVKLLKPLLPLDALRAAAAREFGTLMTVRHPNISYVHDAFEYQSSFFIVTERCHSTLHGLFTLPAFNGLVWLMPIARCLLQAVHALHLRQVVHQDIHAGNVMAAFVKGEMAKPEVEPLHFKLCDLGIARVLNELHVTELRKISIMPPELHDPATYGPLDHRIDVYHVGLLLLQLAYSRLLEFSTQEILEGKPREMALQLPPPYSVALEKALRRHVQYRTADMLELWRDLHTPAGS